MKDIWRATRKQYSAEEKIRIVLEFAWSGRRLVDSLSNRKKCPTGVFVGSSTVHARISFPDIPHVAQKTDNGGQILIAQFVIPNLTYIHCKGSLTVALPKQNRSF